MSAEAYEKAFAEYHDGRFHVAAAWLAIAIDAAESVDGLAALWNKALHEVPYCPDVQLAAGGDRARYGRWTAKGWKESSVPLGTAKRQVIEKLIGWRRRGSGFACPYEHDPDECGAVWWEDE